MLPQALSFVDIETTGTSIRNNKIIEIGIIRVEGKKKVGEFSTLINPYTGLDPFITNLTGITQEALSNAPSFEKVAKDILQILTDSLFVAHNVRFDYGFLKHTFRQYGIEFSMRHACTVKLAKTLYPGLPAYNLDTLIERFRIECRHRHRALDDAKVLWKFYTKTLTEKGETRLETAFNHVLKRPTLPLHITEEELDTLPDSSGVYIFYGDSDLPLYIGKSIHLRERILSHFANDHHSTTDMKISQQIKRVDIRITDGELGALLLESTLIKTLQPLYNRKLRYARKMNGLMLIQTDDGYHAVNQETIDLIIPEQLKTLLGIFSSRKHAQTLLYSLAKQYNLCPKLLGIEQSTRACFFYSLGICFGACITKENPIKYNLRFLQAFYSYRIRDWPFQGPILIKENETSKEIFLIDQWCVLGAIRNELDVSGLLNSQYNFDYHTYKIIYQFIKTHPSSITTLTKHSPYYKSFLTKPISKFY